ncbi:alpha/beta fold hydrolase [Aurantimonas sp. C2-6-R+9]|uniref:alpha/beta hydrolase n=1 Tax=unclassified Aurantimonas TaxID=2638230 RepID=UPI002E173927|nr:MULTISPECIES: alpha/beta fold hydrolase [unclassified Aurantimonas]MEC5292727.1 alpha/beta fold hydrolase [Aurantimonas sp. C2-3-R2]MEC5381012.1 alpha/beta fold hydrolase [Aurantimonas sp. C2-6-R+9]MEC5413765.1 alpha/beta fold hydrolase [Aurantimonas sp. C2-4-R8]
MLLILLVATGCASRPDSQVLAVVPASTTAIEQVTIQIATTRQRDPSNGSYSADRSPTLNFERFTISAPPGHTVTEIEWPKGAPDSQRSFAVTERTILPKLEFKPPSRGSGGTGSRRDVVIFVHGYNYSFEEALFRLAQLAIDGKLTEMPVLFAWPSAASVAGYVADKDAVTYSRDDLVRVLTDIANDPKVGKITVFAHSMGAWLTAEALRQLRLTGQDAIIERLNGVVLAAPDIDVDVFRRQMDIIGPLDPPMTLLVSKDDRALMVSSRIAGSRDRIGTRDVNDPQVQALAGANNIRLIDISEVSALDGANHNRFVGLVTVLPRQGNDVRTGIARAGAFVLEPISATLLPPRP